LTTRSDSTPFGAIEAEPDFAESVVGPEHMTIMRSFVADLARYSEELGLLGPLELPRLWSRHIVNCALVAPLLSAGRVGDVGSGAGLPGLVLAICRPDAELVLIEPMERRVDWLLQEVERLGLTNVSVVRARAEDAKLDTPLDQVTARAVTALAKLIPATAPLLKRGGEMLFLKGERVAHEVEAAAAAIRKARLRHSEVLTLGTGITPEVTRVFRATVD
jgi:16S rRNA (guanine527-N7)-methyltransferase